MNLVTPIKQSVPIFSMVHTMVGHESCLRLIAMKHLIASLVMMLPVYAIGEELRPDFLVLRQNQRMVLVGSGHQTSYEVVNYEPLFSWEGQHSKATFASDVDDLRIEFKLDIIGPDWLFVTLTESDEGLLLCVRRTTTGGVDIDVDANWYSNYTALMEDPQYSSAIAALMRRCGQNPSLPELQSLRTTCFGLAPRPDPIIESHCAELIQELNDDHWAVRDAALEQLARSSMVSYTLSVAHNMRLTPEQRLAIDALSERYRLEFDESLLNSLAAKVLSPPEVAVSQN
jgi:hypothetical protein